MEHTLDLVVCRASDNIIGDVNSLDTGFPDHYSVFFSGCGQEANQTFQRSFLQEIQRY